MKLSIIIVTWNADLLLQRCLHSIIENTKKTSYEIFVIDNASTDQTENICCKQIPKIIYQKNQKNLGFSKACNQGASLAQGEYLLFLNPDTIISNESLSLLIDKMDQDPLIGFIGPKILNIDGSFQAACRRTIPDLKSAFFKLFGFSKLFPSHSLFSKYQLGNLSPDLEMQVEAISGSCLLCRKDVFKKVGGFDEKFFMYGEDLDLCYCITKAGFKGYYLPSAQIIHAHKGSSKKRKFRSLFHFYYSAYLFYQKHHKNRLFRLMVFFFLALKLFLVYLKEIFLAVIRMILLHK